jgi:hypothetical protein
MYIYVSSQADTFQSHLIALNLVTQVLFFKENNAKIKETNAQYTVNNAQCTVNNAQYTVNNAQYK